MRTASPDSKNEPATKRKGKPMITIIAAGIAAIVLLGFGALLVVSRGIPKPFLDPNGQNTPGSISEKIFVPINGVEQGMIIKGRDSSKPVLLYLHGGIPDFFLTQKYPTGLDDDFVVVWWEQRGSGLSYDPAMPKEVLNTEQLILDTIDLTNYLRERFHQDKIYLMGHSGGTFIGIQATSRHPELYHAYIGVAQMSNQLQSEKLAYDYMLEKFKADGNSSMVRKLEQAPVDGNVAPSKAYNMVRDDAMHSLGIGTMHEMKSIVTGLLLESFLNREYTLPEKVNIWRAKSQSGISTMWDQMVVTDLSNQVTELQVPVYFIHGVYDYTVSYSLAKEYFAKIDAPVKGFYSFDGSAHSPMFEEPEKLVNIMREDVLAADNSLADPE